MDEKLNSDIFYDKILPEDVRLAHEMTERLKILSKYSFPKKPSKDGYYRIYVKDAFSKGNRKQLSAKSLDELKDKIYQFEKGICGEKKKTFGDVFQIVQDEKIKYVKNPEKLLSVQNTIARNRSEYKRFFANTFIEVKYIDEITKADLEAIVLKNLKRYDLRKKGLASMQAILKAIFDLAYEQYWIADNTYKRLNFKKFSDLLVESVPVAERVHSDLEIKWMLDYIHATQEKKPRYLPAWALELQILTGTRRGEIPPLRWIDVKEDFLEISRTQITVKATKERKEYFAIVSHTKNYKSRKFPITDDLRDYLIRLRNIHMKYYSKSKFLFPADNENGVITNNVVYGYYRRMCKKLGIEQKHGVIKGTHSFRRNNITEVINATNGNIILASTIFGNTPKVAEKNYYVGTNLAVAKQALNERHFLNQK